MGTTKRSLADAVGSRGFQQERDQAAAGRQVTQSDVQRWKQESTNWARWGAAGERGALNLITPEKRRQAAALVREGISVSLARDAEIEATIDGPRPYEVTPLGITVEEIRVSYHGFIHTHLDFLNHNFIGEGVTYNGYRPDPAVVAARGGHVRNTVDNAKSAIVTRGVLIDMARFRNVPYLEVGGDGGDRLPRATRWSSARVAGLGAPRSAPGTWPTRGRTARVGHFVAQGVGHRDTGWRGGPGHGAGRRGSGRHGGGRWNRRSFRRSYHPLVSVWALTCSSSAISLKTWTAEQESTHRPFDYRKREQWSTTL